MLKRFCDLLDEIKFLKEQKLKPMAELDYESSVNDLAFLIDVTEHLDRLSTKLQGANQIVSDMYNHLRAFARKLLKFSCQLEKIDFTLFPSMSILTSASKEAYFSAITDFREEFTRRFQDLSTHTSKVDDFAKPFCFS